MKCSGHDALAPLETIEMEPEAQAQCRLLKNQSECALHCQMAKALTLSQGTSATPEWKRY